MGLDSTFLFQCLARLSFEMVKCLIFPPPPHAPPPLAIFSLPTQQNVLRVADQEIDEHSTTFVIGNEDHTLGNSLRYYLQKNPEVEFCGFVIRHNPNPQFFKPILPHLE